MRKKIIGALLAVLGCTLGLGACGVQDSDIFGEYEFTNPPKYEIVYDVDEGVVLDGKPDEEFWQNEHSWYTGEFSDGSNGNNKIMYGKLTPCELRVTSHLRIKAHIF